MPMNPHKFADMVFLAEHHTGSLNLADISDVTGRVMTTMYGGLFYFGNFCAPQAEILGNPGCCEAILRVLWS